MKQKINRLVELGFTYNKIAKLAGVPVTSLNDWCKGLRANISDENQEKLEAWLVYFKKEVANM